MKRRRTSCTETEEDMDGRDPRRILETETMSSTDRSQAVRLERSEESENK